ncbi:glycosyltransferase [Actinoplanes sp. Pm04-4]|uniref:Glycosyltransferase n=1 Tax=Paractinoplanes pyxinae TaxID=2997416 RepID=A0ABT4B1C9_9ACTN|nr:glycosyltransferase [Actinoplanes pyxinae]MCY1140318.1 glycosyltransferase [Actinoplanes pyxinae]
MYDVAHLSDLRHTGGSAASLVAEVRAQAAAGLTTVLIHVPADDVPHTRPFDRRVAACLREGLADLAHDDEPELAARVLLIRRPQVVTGKPRVHALHTIVVLDEPPADFAEVRTRVQRHLGPDVVWAPAGPEVRAQLPGAVLPATDWHDSGSHIARLASLGVLSRGVVTTSSVRKARPTRHVLLVGDDIARFRAIARHLPGDLEAVVVAGSAGLADAHAAGLLTEYLPAAAELGVADDRWTGFVRDRLRHLIQLYGPQAVLVGGVPHDGIAAAIGEHPGPRWLWLRPAMWRRGTGGQWAARGALFAGILEPGEFAAAGDEGWTTTARAGVSTVDPITELPAPRPRRATEPTLLCRGVEATLPGFTVVEAGPHELGHVALAVSRAGYTSFHELIGARVPTVFVPDPSAADDELTRARFAAAAGVAVCATDDEAAAAALERLADPAAREALSRRCAEVAFGNGAADAAAWLAGFCPRRSEVEAGSAR